MGFLYRDHRGSLDDSMKTVQYFRDRHRLEAYLASDLASFNAVLIRDSIVVEPYASDDRIGWNDTHIVRGRLDGMPKDELFVLGFTDGPVPPIRCEDCGTTENVHLRNVREVRGGFLWLGIRSKRFPGFLCIPCWKKANPKLFPRKE
jgi:hypothetical protein